MTRLSRLYRRLGPAGRGGALVAAAWLLLSLLGPWLSPIDPQAIDLSRELQPPGAAHWLGAGENGVDVLAQLLAGARVSLVVSLGSVVAAAAVGVLVGAVAGLAGGALEEVLMRAVDVVLAFPGLLLAIFISSVLGPSLRNVVLALTFAGWTGYARLSRAQVRWLLSREYVTAARALGASPARVALRHLLPNAAGPLLVQATFGVPAAILAEASLSFLGLGAPPGTPSWGALIDQGAQYLLVAPHVALFPGLCLAATVLGLNLLGDALRDALAPGQG
jgi:peptide/nickel transport system permease protein